MRFFITLIVFLACSIASAQVPPPPPPEFPLKFDFNDSSQRWANQSPLNPDSISEWAATGGRSGGGIHMRGQNGDKNQPRIWRKLIHTPPTGRQLHISAWVKGENLDNAAGIIAQAHLRGAPDLVGFSNSFRDHTLSGTFDWTRISTTLDVPHECSNVQILLQMTGNGEIWFDDVTVELGGDAILNLPGLFLVQSKINVSSTAADVNSGSIRIPLPLNFRNQIPLTFDLTVDPPQNLDSIALRYDPPNQFAELKLKNLDRIEATVSWSSVVLIGPPSPSPLEPPADPWLADTPVVRSNAAEITALAAQIRTAAPDAPSIIRETIKRAPELSADPHARPVVFFTPTEVAALLRANNIPARLVACLPVTRTHSYPSLLVEAHLPDQGWRTLDPFVDPVHGNLAWPAHEQVVTSIVTMEDERGAHRQSPFDQTLKPAHMRAEPLPADAPLRIVGSIASPVFDCAHICEPLRNLPRDTPPEVWNQLLTAARARWTASFPKSAPPTIQTDAFRQVSPADLLKLLSER